MKKFDVGDIVVLEVYKFKDWWTRHSTNRQSKRHYKKYVFLILEHTHTVQNDAYNVNYNVYQTDIGKLCVYFSTNPYSVVVYKRK